MMKYQMHVSDGLCPVGQRGVVRAQIQFVDIQQELGGVLGLEGAGR